MTDILKSLVGLFSIYLGFSAAYLLLSDLAIIDPSNITGVIRVGENSIDQKV